MDWSKSMKQTFEYYETDPSSWKDKSKLDNILSCTLVRDSSVETLGNASFEVTNTVGECYIRAYLIAEQGEERLKESLGTFLAQTPSSSYDGKIRVVTMDAYTPLLELKEGMPDIGYTVPQGDIVMDRVYELTVEHVRAPVISAQCETAIYTDFVANTDDTWLSFLIDLMANADYEFILDKYSRILFAPIQDAASLQPVWTYTDDNSSILYADISMEHDLYGVPNVVEVIYSSDESYLVSRAVNDNVNSPTSTVNRGREILYRDTDPNLSGEPTQDILDAYAKQVLREQSSVEYTVSYSHGYCPVRLGDCVRLNYERAGIADIKAKVTYQSIECATGCKVTEKATFTTDLWGGD